MQSLFYPLRSRRLKRRYVLALISLCLGGISLPSASFAQEPLPRELVAIGTIGKTVVLERTDTDEVFAQITMHGIAPREIIPSADGRLLFVITQGRRMVEVIDVARKQVVDTIDLSSPSQTVRIFGLAVNRERNTLFVNVLCVDRARDSVHPQEPQIWALDLATHKVTKLLQVPLGVYLLIPSPIDGQPSLCIRRGFICDRPANAPDRQDHPFPIQHCSRRRSPIRFVLSAVSSNQPFELSDSKNRSYYEKGLCWIAQL